ncbi:FIG00469922: hypothetical protein [hydrothermal vent metagenome]|uniref:Protein containing prepilin-type N-cleavage/methylation domain protein n=1 Tax=hydrothermal vent metagenome TaxID=652676 RepID=A0A1W1CH05_9ZZZZ
MKRYAFTMIELIFVIVIMGIIGKFGIEFLAQAYKTFIFSSINNKLQSDSGYAVEYISKRLENRIKESLIARKTIASLPAAPDTVPINFAAGNTYNVLEWVSADVEGFRGLSDALPNLPAWSGIIDLYNPASRATVLVSPGTDTGDIDTLIKALSYGDSDISDAALYSIGANSNVMESFGWSGILTQSGIMHPVTSTAISNQFQSSNEEDFTNADISEYYKLSWTANAVEYQDNGSGSGTLTFYWDYQPWNGDTLANAKHAVIMENVSTFQFRAIGSTIKIQVCTKSILVEEYSLCKEKTIL